MQEKLTAKINIFNFALFLVALLGVVLRFKAYFSSYPLWMDEASLAINILNKDIFEFFAPLEHHQSAPFLFLFCTKALTLFFDTSENVLRIIPFLASLGAIPLFYFLSKKFLNNKISILISNLLFVINYQLIYFACEFKQYSLDVFCCLALFLMFLKVDLEKISNLKIILLSLFSLLAVL